MAASSKQTRPTTKTTKKIDNVQLWFKPEKPVPIELKKSILSDTDDFEASTKTIVEVHLKGIGRFCECGCGKRIEPKRIKSVAGRNRRPVSFIIQPTEKQKYATAKCRQRVNNRKYPNMNRRSLNCRIFLEIIPDKIPYRKLAIYLGKQHQAKTLFKITSEHKELWETLNQIVKYSTFEKPEKRVAISA